MGTKAIRWTIIALTIGAAITLAPLWAPLLLATWVALIARPLLPRFTRWLGGRHRAAGAIVVLLVHILLAPFALAIASLAGGVAELYHKAMGAQNAKSALVALASGGELATLAKDHGGTALAFAGATTEALVALFVFIYAVYAFLVDGPSYYEWIEKHAPIKAEHMRRLKAAWNETGRGLLIGMGLTGVTQGAVATIAYVSLGVPRAFVLGVLTVIASVIPSVGTAIVWVPVAAGLALSGKYVPAAILAGVGVVVIGSIDNILRPVFSRWGKLELDSFIVLISIFGGLAVFGTWGLLLGPLLVRLAKEALSISVSASTGINPSRARTAPDFGSVHTFNTSGRDDEAPSSRHA